MGTLKYMFATISKDLWGIAALYLVGRYMRTADTNSSILDLVVKSRLLENLKTWSEFRNESTGLLLNIYFTYFFLSFFISVALTLSFVAFHVVYPYFAKIVTSLLLPLTVYFFYEITELEDHRTLLLPLSCVYTVYRLYKTYTGHDKSTYEMCSKCFDGFFDQAPSFYFALFSQWIMILLDVFIIRTLNMSTSGILDDSVLLFYMMAFIYTTSYSIRGSLTIYYASRRLPAIQDITAIDKVYIFFNARCFGFVKALTFLPSIIDMLYNTFFSDDIDTATIFEHARSSVFDCMMYRRSYINYKLQQASKIWKGDLRRRMKRMNLREDLLPAALIGWMVLYGCICFIQSNFIRIQESFIIIFSHFFIVIEVFNSFSFVEIYRSSYGIAETSDSKQLSAIMGVDDGIVVSKIAVNHEGEENVELQSG